MLEESVVSSSIIVKNGMALLSCIGHVKPLLFCMSDDVYLSLFSSAMAEFLNHPVHEALVVGKNCSLLHLHDPILLGPAVPGIVDNMILFLESSDNVPYIQPYVSWKGIYLHLALLQK